jgi:hypothetical protein
MYRICPKCRHQREPTDAGASDICPRCGLIFSRYLKTRFKSSALKPGSDKTAHRRQLVLAFLTPEPRRLEPAQLYGYAAIWLAFLIWGLRLLWLDYQSNAIGHSFMHTINLMFHEAGHPIFGLLGNFMGYLGGSLMQVLIPMGVCFAFLWQNRDPFGASIGLWWVGVSLMDLAPYIGDARAMQLTLLGGGTGADRPGMHDWNNILGQLGLLEYDRALAWLMDICGELTVLAALAWGGSVLWRQHRMLA